MTAVDQRGNRPATLDYARRGADEVRRDGRYLVVDVRADLSSRCVRCGKPSAGEPVVRGMLDGRAAALLSDMGPGAAVADGTAAVVFLAFFAVIGLAVLAVALALGHRRRVAFGLCDAHRCRRHTLRCAAAATGTAAVGLLAATAAQLDVRPRDVVTLWVFVLLTATLAIAALFLNRGGVGVSLHKSVGNELWLAGVGPGFLDAVTGR